MRKDRGNGRPSRLSPRCPSSAGVNIAAGTTGTVTIKLNATGRRATRHGHLRAWANFTLGSTHLSRRITLRG